MPPGGAYPVGTRSSGRDRLVRAAELALAVAADELPAYSCPKSPRRFTQPQLLACLVLRADLRQTYRGVAARLASSDALRQSLGLARVPDHSTLPRFADRAVTPDGIDRRLGRRVERVGPAVADVAMDATGMEPSNASGYYTARRGTRHRGYVKLSLVIVCGCLLPLAVVVSRGPRHDTSEAAELLENGQTHEKHRCPPRHDTSEAAELLGAWTCATTAPGGEPRHDTSEAAELLGRAAAKARPKRLFADTGYDAERVHEFRDDRWKVRSDIPAVVKRRDGRIGGKYRSRMGRVPKAYGKRWHAEALMSGLKRTTGSALTARKANTLDAEAASGCWPTRFATDPAVFNTARRGHGRPGRSEAGVYGSGLRPGGPHQLREGGRWNQPTRACCRGPTCRGGRTSSDPGRSPAAAPGSCPGTPSCTRSTACRAVTAWCSGRPPSGTSSSCPTRRRCGPCPVRATRPSPPRPGRHLPGRRDGRGLRHLRASAAAPGGEPARPVRALLRGAGGDAVGPAARLGDPPRRCGRGPGRPAGLVASPANPPVRGSSHVSPARSRPRLAAGGHCRSPARRQVARHRAGGGRGRRANRRQRRVHHQVRPVVEEGRQGADPGEDRRPGGAAERGREAGGGQGDGQAGGRRGAIRQGGERLDAEKNAAALVEKALAGFPLNGLTAAVEGKPEVVDRKDDQATVRLKVKYRADLEAYDAFAALLGADLDKVARSKGQFSLRAEFGPAARQRLDFDGYYFEGHYRLMMPRLFGPNGEYSGRKDTFVSVRIRQ